MQPIAGTKPADLPAAREAGKQYGSALSPLNLPIEAARPMLVNAAHAYAHDNGHGLSSGDFRATQEAFVEAALETFVPVEVEPVVSPATKPEPAPQLTLGGYTSRKQPTPTAVALVPEEADK